MTVESFFTEPTPDRFLPTDYTRGPWNIDSCHAGPVTALLVRAVESLVDQQLVRMTVELQRPVPMNGFSVRSSVVRTGRSVSRTTAEIYNGDTVFAQAVGVHIRTEDLSDVPTPEVELPDFNNTVAGPFSVPDTVHDAIWFADGVDCRFPTGADVGFGGPSTIWMRNRVPILPDEVPSPFQKLAPLADCANGVSRNGQLDSFSFLNVDLTLSLIRKPIGDWFVSQSISHWQPNGIGLADAELFDQHGPVGRATQSLILGRSI